MPAAVAVALEEIVIVLANVTLVAAAGVVGAEIAIVPVAAFTNVTVAPTGTFVPLIAMPTRTFPISLAVKPEISVLPAVFDRPVEVNVGTTEVTLALLA